MKWIVRLGKYEKHNRTIIRQLFNESDMNSFKVHEKMRLAAKHLLNV